MSRQAAQLSFKTAGILEVCRGFSRRINAEFGTKDFFEMDSNNHHEKNEEVDMKLFVSFMVNKPFPHYSFGTLF
jgi:hypothetical protein